MIFAVVNDVSNYYNILNLINLVKIKSLNGRKNSCQKKKELFRRVNVL